MEQTLLDGRVSPDVGNHIRVRVLRTRAGDLVVDRPHKDSPLKLTPADGDLSIPEEPGTYELRGEVKTFARSAGRGPDYLILNEPTVVQVSSELIEITTADSKDKSGSDTAVGGLDIDPDILPTEQTESQETHTPNDRAAIDRDNGIDRKRNELLLE